MKKLMIVLAACAALGAEAKLSLGTPFADGMVLQRDKLIPVWGWADPGKEIVVSFAWRSVSTTADANGKWRVTLPAFEASKESRVLKVASYPADSRVWYLCWGWFATAEDVVSVKDVLVGEVWYCSGQSNTELPLCGNSPHFRDRKGAMRAMMTNKPNIRFCYASNYRCSVDPKAKADYAVTWKKFTPAALLGQDGGRSFSAMGVYFALELYSALDVPVGIVGSYWGGTRAEPWTPREGFQLTKGCEPEAAYKANVADYKPEMTKCLPHQVSRVQDQPSVLWNEMVEPWAPMAMRGFIWYQGCSNSGQPDRYDTIMHALYNGWAKRFENPNLKLAFVQLAPWGNANIAAIQEAQSRFVADEKNARMAVINDIGNLRDIHPYDKETVGQRLAALVLKHDYGFSAIHADAPTFRSWKVEGNKAILSFNNAESLYLYNPDFTMVNGFELAGADGKFVPATIVNLVPRMDHKTKKPTNSSLGNIKGNVIELTAPDVEAPVKVRYLYSAPWYGGIHNEGNMPMPAFQASK